MANADAESVAMMMLAGSHRMPCSSRNLYNFVVVYDAFVNAMSSRYGRETALVGFRRTVCKSGCTMCFVDDPSFKTCTRKWFPQCRCCPASDAVYNTYVHCIVHTSALLVW